MLNVLILLGLLGAACLILFYFLPRAVHDAVESGAADNLSDATNNLKRAIKSAARNDWDRIRKFVRRFTD